MRHLAAALALLAAAPALAANGMRAIGFGPVQILTIGAGFRPLSALLVAADLQWIDWSGVLGPGSSLRLGWEDQVVLKLGVQWHLDALDIRAGLDYGRSPLDPDLAFDMMLPAVAETHLGLGVGVPLGSAVTLNLGLVWSPRATVTGTDTTSFGGAPVPFQVSGSSFSVDAGVAIGF